MNKSELIDAISENSGLGKGKTELFLNTFMEVIIETVANGDKIQLVGFGTFEKRHRDARVGRNPKTGDELKIPAVDVPAFKAGKNFKEACAK